MPYSQKMLKCRLQSQVIGVSEITKRSYGVDGMTWIYRALRRQLKAAVLPPRGEYQLSGIPKKRVGLIHAEFVEHKHTVQGSKWASLEKPPVGCRPILAAVVIPVREYGFYVGTIVSIHAAVLSKFVRSALQAVFLPFHILHDHIIDIAEGCAIFQHLPWRIGMEMNFDQCLVTNCEQAVAFYMRCDVCMNGIF